MPKQKHHQHHRRRGVPLGGLRLPTRYLYNPPGMPPFTYPEGWTPRPPNFGAIYRLYLALAGGVIALMLIAWAVISIFGPH